MLIDSISLSIIFLNFNRLSETKCTTERLRLMVGKRRDIEVIAVDNGSQDGTADYLQQETWLRAVLLTKNTGIAGYNVGFEQARGRYLLVLDDDSCPEDIATIERAIARLDEYPQIGIVAFCIVTDAGERQWSWHIPTQNRDGPSMAFIGCGFAIRSDVFRKIGWYPENFFLYQNEVDVAIRVRCLGYEIYYDHLCRSIHRGNIKSRPSWRRVYYPTRNTIWIIRRYFPYPESVYLIFSRLVIGLVRSVWFWEIGCYIKSVWDAFKEPIVKEPLPKAVLNEFAVFWRQNSIWHQLLRKT